MTGCPHLNGEQNIYVLGSQSLMAGLNDKVHEQQGGPLLANQSQPRAAISAADEAIQQSGATAYRRAKW